MSSLNLKFMGYVRSVRAVIPHMRQRGEGAIVAHELAQQSIPCGRICAPEEVAALVTFLASPLASFINGAHIPWTGPAQGNHGLAGQAAGRRRCVRTVRPGAGRRRCVRATAKDVRLGPSFARYAQFNLTA